MSLLSSLLLDPEPLNIWVAWRTDGIKGSGTQSDPFNGSTRAAFDQAMASLPDDRPVRVHLGPTPPNKPFQTSGFYLKADGSPGTGAWMPKPYMAILGSGRGATCLQLVPGTASGYHYFAIGAPTTVSLDHFTITGLTIDCNLPAEATVACGAIRVMGQHVRVRDVECVNWGNRITGGQPGFVIALIIADPDPDSPWLAVDDVGMEHCRAAGPSPHSNAGVMNVLHVGGRELAGVTVTQFGRASFIRHCFVDGGDLSAGTTFRGLSMGGCHGGMVVGNHVQNTAIGGPYQDKMNTREIIVQNNTYRNVLIGPCWILNRSGSNLTSTPASVTRLAIVIMPNLQEHGFSRGDSVILVSASAAFTGTFEIVGILQPDQFVIPVATTESFSTISSIKLYPGGSEILGANALVYGHAGEVMVTLPSSTAHGLNKGQRVKLDADTPGFDGCFEVTAVYRNDRFNIGTPAQDTSGSVNHIYALYGVDKVLIQDNHIELSPGAPDTPPVGIYLHDTGPTSQPCPYGRVIIRGNRVRYLDGVFGTFDVYHRFVPGTGYGIEANGVATLALVDNLVETNPIGSQTIKSARCASVTQSDDRIPGNIVVLAEEDIYQQQLENPAEDAFASGCFSK